MKKLTTLALAGAMAVASFASASATRWTGFGIASLFIADVQDTFTLPQTVASNPDALYLEFGPQYHYDAVNQYYTDIPGTPADYSVDGSAWGGAHLKLGPGVLGIWGNRPYYGASNLYFNISFPDYYGTGGDAGTNFLTPQNTVDVIYGWNMGDKLTLAVGVNHSYEKYYEHVTRIPNFYEWTYDDTASDWGLSLGADIKDLGPIAALQIGLQYNMGTAKNSYNDGNYTNENTMDYSVAALRVGADINGSKGKFQRAEVDINLQNGQAKTNPSSGFPSTDYYASESASASSVILGWAMGMSSAKGMGLSGLILTEMWGSSDAPNYTYANGSKDHYNWQSTDLSFVSAGEGKINNWLTGRAGFSTTVFGDSSWGRENHWNSSNGKIRDYRYSEYSTTITLGLSLIFGDITIDGALNQDLLYNGLYFTNGIATPLFSQVSATWAWGASKE